MNEQQWPPAGVKWYYQDDAVCIAHGDCREIVPTLGRFDLCITDPPYDMQIGGGGCFRDRKYLADIKGFTDGGFDASILSYCDNWFCFCSKDQLIELLVLASKQRWMLIPWHKTNPTPLVNGTYLPDTEYIVHSFAPNRLFGEYKDKARFILHPAQQNNVHPNEKPLSVMLKLVASGSDKGDVIVDFYAGSGTTGRAAKDLGRKCVLIEREERYCEIAANRMSQEVLPLDFATERNTNT